MIVLKKFNLDKGMITFSDFIINWENKKDRKPLKQLKDTFKLVQLVKGLATSLSQTQIDLVFTNKPKKDM